MQTLWTGAVLVACGVRVRRSGPAAPPGALVVANHVSWLDVMALHAVAPVRMLAKREVRRWPLLGVMAASAGTVFLDRDRLRTLPDAVAGLAAALRAGATIGVFAEGTTRCGRDLGPFRPAAFQAAHDAGAPVVPVAVRYRRRGEGPVDATAAFVGDDTLASSLLRVLAARDLVVDVDVRPALDPRAVPAGPARADARRTLARASAAAIAAAPARRPRGPPRRRAPGCGDPSTPGARACRLTRPPARPRARPPWPTGRCSPRSSSAPRSPRRRCGRAAPRSPARWPTRPCASARPAPVVVELGAGSGAFTGLLAHRLAGRGRQLAVEINPVLAHRLAERFAHVEVVPADVAELPALLALRGIAGADVVVSGLGWSATRPGREDSLVPGVARALADDGVLVQFAYCATSWAAPARALRAELGECFEQVGDLVRGVAQPAPGRRPPGVPSAAVRIPAVRCPGGDGEPQRGARG